MEDNDSAPELQLVIEHLPAGFEALREEARAEGYLFVERLAADWEHAGCVSIVMARRCSPRI